MTYRLGVDVGGTFTDLLLFAEDSGQSHRVKVPSTPHDPAAAVLHGTRRICAAAGIEPRDIAYFFHGTTVATNAVLQHKGARVGLVTTTGYKQVLQVARSLVPGGLAAWIVWPKPEPLARLEDTVEVPGRIGADGGEVAPLDEAAVRAALGTLAGSGIEALTVCLINSYVNGAHERHVGRIAREIFPALPISLSHEILPEMQEYERTLTTVANSAMSPVVGRYVGSLREQLEGVGFRGTLRLLRSDGGLQSAQESERAPVNLLMSGPAGGVTGALWVARHAGYRNILTLDVGGTSTDVALIEDGEPKRRRTTEVGALTVRASSLDVRSVGAGGGSIAHVPELTGALRVGPESAGAAPGPACYGQGGERPTVTDANLVLGYLPGELLGGEMQLDRERAARAVQTIADALGVSLHEAAAGIIDIVNENMCGALRLVSVQRGYDPRAFALMGFGGAGALHANAVARLMGSWPVIVPNSPGLLCAAGDASTQIRSEFARSLAVREDAIDEREVAAVLAALAREVHARLAGEGVARTDIDLRFEVDVRYIGQGFEIPIAVSPDAFGSGGLAALCLAFDREHERRFGFNLAAPREYVNARAIGLGRAIELPAVRIARGSGDASAAVIRRDHRIWIGGSAQHATLYARAGLGAGDEFHGPAIVVEMDSTALVLPEHVATVDDFGNLLISPEGGAGR